MPSSLVVLMLLAFACHKGNHDAEYKMTALSAPPLRTGLGSSALKITTKSAKAQLYFTQGLELLHCFWDFEAYRAFKEASRLDPDAPMPYWGIVQSISDYKAMDDEKDAALEKAKKLMDKASDHEKYYLRAQQKAQEDEGDAAWRKEMEELVGSYPDDVDAKLFLAISRPNGSEVYAESLLRNILADHPDSAAAHHYMIHTLEAGPHADRALASADALGRLAPASGHMVHMPGHIYYKLGDQDRARESFLASMKVDEDYMKKEKVSTQDDWNYAHNLSYLIASDAEAGRYREALELAGKLDKVPANPFLAVGKPTHAMTVGSTTVRLQLRFGNWQAVIDHPVEVGDPSKSGPAAIAFRDGIAAYAHGMLALENKRMAEASHQADTLDAIQWRLKSDQDGDDDETKPDHVLRLLTTASLDLRGNLQCALGKLDEGVRLLKKAIDKEKEVGYNEPPQYGRPESESLGYAYLAAGKFAEAKAAFEDELKLRPKSGHALYGLALAREKSGAKEAYSDFLEAWKSADPDLPMMKHARHM